MSGLFAPSSIAIPSFLGGPAAAPAPSAATLQAMAAAAPAAPTMATETWASASQLEMASLQQELRRVQQELERLIASLSAAAPTRGVIGQLWGDLTRWFQPTPAKPPKATPAPAPAPTGKTDFVLSSFNVLSSNAGKGKGFAPGTARMRSVVEILRANQVSVVGFQEMDHAQLAEFKKLAGDTYATHAGESGKRGYHDAALAWRKDTWKLVQAGSLDVPSYGGRNSKVPYVRLRNKQTGQEAYFIDAHNPANTKNYHHQERFRDEAARREAALADRLIQESGLPVFVVGDMNSVKEAQAIFTQGAALKAANPPKKAGIDWIFGSKDVIFSQFRRVRDGLIPKTTDHPVVFSHVRIKD